EPPEKYDATAATMSSPTAMAKELARRITVGDVWGWQSRWGVRRLRLVRSREDWPARRKFSIVTGIPTWLRLAGVVCTTSSPVDSAERHYDSVDLPWEIAMVEGASTSVPIDITLGKWSGRLRLPVHVVPTPENAMRPVQSPALDAAIMKSLDCGI